MLKCKAENIMITLYTQNVSTNISPCMTEKDTRLCIIYIDVYAFTYSTFLYAQQYISIYSVYSIRMVQIPHCLLQQKNIFFVIRLNRITDTYP